jgi:hypothetical protein
MQPIERYIEVVEEGVEKLRTGGKYSLHLLNVNLPAEKGFFEIGISKEEGHVQGWNGPLQPWYETSSLDEIMQTFDDLGFAASQLMAFERFKDLLGEVVRVVRNTEETAQFMLIAKDRIVLFHINTDWDSISEFYGTYVKTTKH